MDLRRYGAALALALVALSFSGTAAAGANVDISNIEAPSFVDKGDTVRVKVTVTNTADEEAYQMEVKAKGFDQVKEENLWSMDPGEEDTLSFYLESPDDEEGTHEIEISVQSRDEDGRVIGGEKTNISIDVGDDGAVVHGDEGDLEIRSVTMPGTVMPGESFDIEVTVRNTGERDMGGLHVSTKAFGRTVTEDAGTIDGKTTRTVPVKISVPSASRGQEEAMIEASTFNDQDTLNTTISISDTHISMQLRQETVSVGDHVTVSGILSRRNARADLLYAGRFEAPVFSDETGHFAHTIIPERPGVFTVALVSGTARIEKLLTVEPRIDVRGLSAPTRVGLDSFFNVCGLVSRAATGEAELRLLVDGQPQKTKSIVAGAEREQCLSTSIADEGNHTVRFEVTADGVTAFDETEVRAVSTGISAVVFPDQLTLTRGQAGVFQVRIDNDRLKDRKFDITVDGFDNVSVDAPDTVTVRRSTSKTSFVRVVPPAAGTHTARVTVAEGETVHTEMQIEVLAVENPALKNPVIGAVARQAASTYNRSQGLKKQEKWAVLGAIGVFLLTLFWLWRRRHSGVIEPQY